MPRTKHTITNFHAFSSNSKDSSWRIPKAVQPELMSATAKRLKQREADLARLDELIAAFKDPVAAQVQAGVKAGIKSGKGTEASMREDNDRLKKQLSRPAFAAAYFVAQRHTFMARKRLSAGLPQRRLA